MEGILSPKNGFLRLEDFPEGFTFGSATSAFQIEGGTKEGGRVPSIWDDFAHKHKLYGKYDPDRVVGHYYRFKDDVKMMKRMGILAYRFSISWTRIISYDLRHPTGATKKFENPEGIAFYNDLIDELLANDIEPFVTLFHWDSPQFLETLYQGFLNRRITHEFADYCDTCFRNFGDRVKYWITLNEPWSFSTFGYALGLFPPGRGGPSSHSSATIMNFLPPSPYINEIAFKRTRFIHDTTVGDPGREPYKVTHHMLLAHAKVVQLYRQKYQPIQKGKIGIALVSQWYEPLNPNLEEDCLAAERAIDFMFGWFMDPLISGDYPESMKAYVTDDRLPKFTKEDSDLVKGSFDFIGLNYYTTNYVANAPKAGDGAAPSYVTDPKVAYYTERNGVPIGPKGGSSWLYVYPKGIMDLLLYTKMKYKSPLIYITENGIDEKNDDSLLLWDSLFDHQRISYHHDHLRFVKIAIEAGVNVKGYFTWSLMDNFEWVESFDVRFGNNFIDYNNGSERIPKLSCAWIRLFLHKNK